jgi:hypothetical protein
MINVINQRLQCHFIRKNFIQSQMSVLRLNDTYITLDNNQNITIINPSNSIANSVRREAFTLFKCNSAAFHVLKYDLQCRLDIELLLDKTDLAIKIADQLSELEMQCLLKIINYIFDMTKNIVIINDFQDFNELDFSTYCDFKYYVCNYKTRLSMKTIHDVNNNIIRCDTIEPGIILAIDKLDGFLINDINCNQDLDANTLAVNITTRSKFGLLVREPQRVVKFIDKEVYYKNNLNKFKWLMNGEKNE